jgi:hypothetical protein
MVEERSWRRWRAYGFDRLTEGSGVIVGVGVYACTSYIVQCHHVKSPLSLLFSFHFRPFITNFR